MTIPMPGTVKIRLYSPLLHREHREHWITISGLTVETPGGVLIEWSAGVQIIDFGPEHWRLPVDRWNRAGIGSCHDTIAPPISVGQPSHRGAGRDVHLLIVARIGRLTNYRAEQAIRQRPL